MDNQGSADVKKHSFEAEVAQLLHLVTHSLYSNADIFVRELVSNASDACDKLRFEATNDDSLYEDDGELKIRIDVDTEAKTISFIDNGIGMNEADAIENLGTIAKSGTKAFLDKLSESQKQDGQLIGQFGVGFYSGFIVADTITVESRKAGEPANQHQQIFGDGGNGIAGARCQIQVLQQRQLQQSRQIAHQLGGNDKHQNGNQHRAEGNRLDTFHALHGGGDIPQRDILQEAERRMDF